MKTKKFWVYRMYKTSEDLDLPRTLDSLALSTYLRVLTLSENRLDTSRTVFIENRNINAKQPKFSYHLAPSSQFHYIPCFLLLGCLDRTECFSVCTDFPEIWEVWWVLLHKRNSWGEYVENLFFLFWDRISLKGPG